MMASADEGCEGKSMEARLGAWDVQQRYGKRMKPVFWTTLGTIFLKPTSLPMCSGPPANFRATAAHGGSTTATTAEAGPDTTDIGKSSEWSCCFLCLSRHGRTESHRDAYYTCLVYIYIYTYIYVYLSLSLSIHRHTHTHTHTHNLCVCISEP